MESSSSRQSDNRHPFANFKYQTHSAKESLKNLSRTHGHKNNKNSPLHKPTVNRISTRPSRHLPCAGPSSLLPTSSIGRHSATLNIPKESRRSARDQRHAVLTEHISYLILGCSRSFLSPWLLSTIGSSLDPASFISRTSKIEQSRLSLNSRLWRAVTSERPETIAGHESSLKEERGCGIDRSIDRSIGWIDERGYRRAIYHRRT